MWMENEMVDLASKSVMQGPSFTYMLNWDPWGKARQGMMLHGYLDIPNPHHHNNMPSSPSCTSVGYHWWTACFVSKLVKYAWCCHWCIAKWKELKQTVFSFVHFCEISPMGFMFLINNSVEIAWFILPLGKKVTRRTTRSLFVYHTHTVWSDCHRTKRLRTP